MRNATLCIALLSISVGCKNESKGDELPPATGPNAAPRPELPKLDGKNGDTQTAEVSDQTTGTTYPRAHADVAPTMSGVIASIAVEEGDPVKKGQVLFRLRPTDMALQVKQAEAAQRSAEVGLAAAQVERDRTKQLFDKKAVDPATWDAVKARYDAAVAAVNQAKVGVSMARKALGDATVRSPIAGVVTHKLKNAGEMATMMPPSIVVTVEDHSALELRFRLPERLVNAVKPGTGLKASFASAGVERDAKVARVSPSIDPRTRTFEVVAMVDNADAALKSGMLATVALAEGAP